MKKNHKSTKKYSTDKLLRTVAVSLFRDFHNEIADVSSCGAFFDSLNRESIADIRTSCPTPTDEMSPAVYKRVYQLGSLLKRYRFSNDLYTDEELTAKALATFAETQVRIRAISLDSPSAFTGLVLRRARVYLAKVLGKYDDVEHRDLCRFGRRASVGIKASDACEGARWQIPISGSQSQISWFRSEMDGIDCVREYLNAQLESDPNGSLYQEVSSLKMVLVPKTFKSLRSIMPNTTIGSYMSFGLGEMMRKRLKGIGFNLSTLQEEHRELARRGSVHGMYVTADLSSASDSISVALLEKLLPKDWFNILIESRIGQVELPDGSIVHSETFCTMGIGYTFPLQTLVFLSLLMAIRVSLFGPRFRSTISVYGDDMIYIRSMHSAVVETFAELGFVINLDKTFDDGHFRESCGGDYYHGVDVRPFSPQNGPAHVSAKGYEAVLYKLLNGLLRRWSEYEVESTLRFLMSEIGALVGQCKIVPRDYPDDSGLKVDGASPFSFLKGRTDVVKPKAIGHGLFRFPYLASKVDLKEENRHVPYLWLALRDDLSRTVHYDSSGHHQRRVPPLPNLIDDLVGCNTRLPSFIIEESRTETVRSKISGRRLRRQQTYVGIPHTGRYKRQSGVSSF